MTKALLIIDHGSKIAAANDMLLDVKKMMQGLRPELIIEVAHMELASPTIEEGFAACVKKGATHIIASPYMLSPGRHALQDIPRLVGQANQHFPEVSSMVSGPFGVQEKIAEIILELTGLV